MKITKSREENSISNENSIYFTDSSSPNKRAKILTLRLELVNVPQVNVGIARRVVVIVVGVGVVVVVARGAGVIAGGLAGHGGRAVAGRLGLLLLLGPVSWGRALPPPAVRLLLLLLLLLAARGTAEVMVAPCKHGENRRD